MRYQKPVTILVFVIAVLAAVAASMGIFVTGGHGTYTFESIHGERVQIYGTGIYQHMSAEVAPQGIAQDYVTLFIGVPLLLVSLFYARSGSFRSRFVLAGTLGYFLVTYLFFLMMAMFNILFLVYTILLGTSFFGFVLTLFSFDIHRLPSLFRETVPTGAAGGFLIFNSIAIALLWLGVVVPPLLEGSVIPPQVEHYTTLVVQGLDLGLLLPLSFVSGILFIRRRPLGYLLAPVYLVFLSLLMMALIAKITAMGILGRNIIPAIFIIPVITLASILFTVLVLINTRDEEKHDLPGY